MEPQPGTPAPGNANGYDFILSPNQQKKGAGFGFGKDPFITKIIFLVGGAVVLMIAAGVLISLVFGSKTGVGTFVSIAQRQQEIMRISALGGDAASQDIRNAAINTEVSVTSQQGKTVAYLAAHRHSVAAAELALKKNATTDTRLSQAKANGTFDTIFASTMRSQLTAYANELKSVYDGRSNSTQRQLLGQQYLDVRLLLKQWPENSTTQ